MSAKFEKKIRKAVKEEVIMCEFCDELTFSKSIEEKDIEKVYRLRLEVNNRINGVYRGSYMTNKKYLIKYCPLCGKRIKP